MKPYLWAICLPGCHGADPVHEPEEGEQADRWLGPHLCVQVELLDENILHPVHVRGRAASLGNVD